MMCRKIISLTLAILLVFTILTSCSGNNGTQSDFDGNLIGDIGDSTAYNYNLSEYIKVGQYKGVAVDVRKATVTDEQLADEIDYILYSNSASEEIRSGIVEVGDIVNIDYVGTMDGAAFEGGSDENYNLTIGNGSFIPGFEDGLVGKEIGSTVKLDIKFPDPYLNKADFSGKDVTFEVTLNYIFNLVQPEYTDEFVQSISDEYKTVDEYSNYVRQYLLEENKQRAESEKAQSAWSIVRESSEVLKYPENEYQQYYNEFVSYYESEASKAGKTLEVYVSENYNTTLDEFYGEAKNYAEGYVLDDLIFYYIVRTENIYVTEDEYASGLQEYFNYYQSYGFSNTDELEEEYGRNALLTSMLWDKVMKFIADNAVVTEK